MIASGATISTDCPHIYMLFPRTRPISTDFASLYLCVIS